MYGLTSREGQFHQRSAPAQQPALFRECEETESPRRDPKSPNAPSLKQPDVSHRAQKSPRNYPRVSKIGCRGWIRTNDLQVMSLTSYRAAPPCNKWDGEPCFRSPLCQRPFYKKSDSPLASPFPALCALAFLHPFRARENQQPQHSSPDRKAAHWSTCVPKDNIDP